MSKYIDADKLIHDLEERIFAYSEGYAEGDDNRKDAIETLLKDVKYQYSLQQEQPEKPVPNDLKETADNHIRKVADTAGHPGWDWTTQDIAEAFIAGAKWQAEKCDEETSKLLYAERQTAYINGWHDCKEQMLKGAVEGTVTCHNLNRYILVSGLDESLTYGDKVHIIIVKEDGK